MTSTKKLQNLLHGLLVVFMAFSVVHTAEAKKRKSLKNELDSEISKMMGDEPPAPRPRRIMPRRQVKPQTSRIPKQKKVVSVNYESQYNDDGTPVNMKVPQRRESPVVPPQASRSSYAQQEAPLSTKYRVVRDEPVTYRPVSVMRSDVDSDGWERSRKVGINVYTFYNFTDQLETTNRSATASYYNSSSGLRPLSEMTGEYNATPSFGVGIEHSMRHLISSGSFGLGYSLGTAYEFGREVQRTYVTEYGDKLNMQNNPMLSLLTPYLNLVMTYEPVYVFGGVNYGVPFMERVGPEKYEGMVGFQAGIGAEITSWMALELSYRMVQFEGKPRDSEALFYSQGNYGPYFYQRDPGYDQGLGMLEKERFTLAGFNLNLKIQF